MPILQWMMAVTVFVWGFLASVLTGSPVWLTWIGFGVSLLILIILSFGGFRQTGPSEQGISF